MSRLWKWWRQRLGIPARSVAQDHSTSEARAARQKSERDLARIRAARSEVSRVTEILRADTVQDQIVEMIKDTIKRGPDPHHER